MIETFYKTIRPTMLKRRITRPLYESTRRAVIVEDVRSWRHYKRAERDAGLAPCLDHPLFSSWRCEICGIGIGPGYNQAYMYLCPVYKEFVNNPKSDKRLRWYDIKTLKICGDCAAHPTRQLPDWLCVLTPDMYETTILLCEEDTVPVTLQRQDEEQIKQVIAAIDDYIDGRQYILYLFHLFFFNVSLSWFFKMIAKREQEVSSLMILVVDQAVKVNTEFRDEIVLFEDSLDPLYYALSQQHRPVFLQSALFS